MGFHNTPMGESHPTGLFGGQHIGFGQDRLCFVSSFIQLHNFFEKNYTRKH